jgi:LruC domain-containing protein
VSGDAGDSETDVVTATGRDDEGNSVSDSDEATVNITPPRLYHLYFPAVSSAGVVECALLGDWQVTVGYEDLPSRSDYDYNDWVAEILGHMTYDRAANCNLSKIEFQIDAKARGAAYDHAFHLLIPANTFSGNGTATLTIYDQNHNVISAVQTPFNAAQANDYLVFPHTSDVLPGMANVFEGRASVTPLRSAVLTIEFTNPIPFDPGDFDFAAPHGTGLFFDPYLYVINWGGSVHRGDFKMLTSPELNWMWPEEGRKIWQVYTDLIYQPGPPENLIFPPNWWLTHNDCVYGDHVICSLP